MASGGAEGARGATEAAGEPMAARFEDGSGLVLVWDGSFAGFLCAVARGASIAREGSPFPALRRKDEAPGLFEAGIEVRTDSKLARRVWDRIGELAGDEGAEECHAAFLSEDSEARAALARTIPRLGACKTGGACRAGGASTAGGSTAAPIGLSDSDSMRVMEAARRVRGQAQKICGLTRFSELADGSWYAPIHPDCDILPLIAGHFAARYADMRFIIHDLGRVKALLHRPGDRWRIVPGFALGSARLPVSEKEMEIQRGWRLYFDTVAIEERKNPRLQSAHMPKKYWPLLPEMGTIAL